MPALRRRLVSVLTIVLLLFLPSAQALAKPPQAQAPTAVTVMSRNLYLGADLFPLVGAVLSGAPAETLVQLAGQTFQTVVASDFAERAEALAKEIETTRPDVIGLQEVTTWVTGLLSDGSPTSMLDFLSVLQAELASRGLDYNVASTVTNFSGALPLSATEYVSYTDRDVILVREGVTTANPDSGNFSVGIDLPDELGLGDIVLRGWTSVDVTIDGRTFRVVNTHPEAWGPDALRIGQTSELLQGPLDTTLPVILLGDLNTEPGSIPYTMLANAGFVDWWQPSRPGPTCCQDADIRNKKSDLDKRIDYVLTRDGAELTWRTTMVRLVGNTTGSLTPSGLWPSDHAGVVARLLLR